MLINADALMNVSVLTLRHSHLNARTSECIHANMHSDTHAYMHIHTPTYMHACTLKHPYIYGYINSNL